MTEYRTNLTCNLCNSKLQTGWCKGKLFWYIKLKFIMIRHLRKEHKMSWFEIIGGK